LREGFPPDAFGMLSRLRGSAHLRHIESERSAGRSEAPARRATGIANDPR
jgi:hypothetical protein